MKNKTGFSLARIPGFDRTSRFFFGLSGKAVRQVLLWCALVVSVIAYDHNLRHQAEPFIKSSLQNNAAFSAEVNNPDSQTKSFRTQIDSLRVQLTRLQELTAKVKSAAGFDYKSSSYARKLGVGGSYSKNLAFSLSDPSGYNEWVNGLDAEINQLDDASIEHFDEYQVLLATVKEIRRIQDATPAICPVEDGRISSNFGYRESPFKGTKEFHSGLDISGRKGTPVKATADGRVLHAGYNGDLGKEVIIDHGFGIVTVYGHLNEIKTKAGQQVKRGTIIGAIGNTGRSTGPHLHYEVRLNNQPINPKKYIPEYLASRDISK
jgi:murein DD-endopeptidase MepM/ murein hydrolase activator NlpD